MPTVTAKFDHFFLFRRIFFRRLSSCLLAWSPVGSRGCPSALYPGGQRSRRWDSAAMWIQAGAPSITVAFAQLTVHKPPTITSTCAQTSVFSRQQSGEKNEHGWCYLRATTSVLLSSTSTALPADGVLAIPRHERKAARRRRSFRRRQSPITRGQRKTLRELSPKYGLAMDYKDR